MSLCVAGHYRQAAGHALHDVEGQPLRPTGGHGDIRRTQPHGDIVDLTGKTHALRHAQLIGQCAARLQPCAAARQQQLDLRRQQRQSAEQRGLCLPFRELRRIDQRDILLRQAQLVPHSLSRRPRRLKAAEIHAHAGNLLHASRRVMRLGPPGVPGIHGQHQIGLGCRQQLRLCQQQLFGRRCLVVEQVAVNHVDDLGPVTQSANRPAGKERSQRGVGDDQIVVFPLHHAPQQLSRPEVGRRGHLLFQRQHGGHVGKWDVPHDAAAGHTDLPPQLAEAPQVGEVEIDDMGKCRCRTQYRWHDRSSYIAFPAAGHAAPSSSLRYAVTSSGSVIAPRFCWFQCSSFSKSCAAPWRNASLPSLCCMTMRKLVSHVLGSEEV